MSKANLTLTVLESLAALFLYFTLKYLSFVKSLKYPYQLEIFFFFFLLKMVV